MPPPTVTYVLSSMTLSHFRPASFKILGGVITFLLSFSLGTYFYCAPNSARCRNNGVWDGGAWGGYACRTEYCEASCVEEDFPDMFIKARSLALSNIAFVVIGVIIWFVGWEDYVEFKGDGPNALVSCGNGMLNLLLTFLGGSILIWAGVASFFFHASMTQVSLDLDMLSVWTLVVCMLPFMAALQFVHVLAVFISSVAPQASLVQLKPALELHGDTIVMVSGSTGMLVAAFLPHFWDPGEPTTTVPIGAAMNFLLFLSNYAVRYSKVTFRDRRDSWLLFAAVALMGIAYSCQEDSGCNKWASVSPTSFIQGHSIWHGFMALGVGFFYAALRQERRREEDEGWREREGSMKGSSELMSVDKEKVYPVMV